MTFSLGIQVGFEVSVTLEGEGSDSYLIFPVNFSDQMSLQELYFPSSASKGYIGKQRRDLSITSHRSISYINMTVGGRDLYT